MIKELWHICVEGLHRMLLPMLKYDQDGGDRFSDVEFTAHHYNTKQCGALEALAEILKVRNGGRKAMNYSETSLCCGHP